jgi:hypothetical protein
VELFRFACPPRWGRAVGAVFASPPWVRVKRYVVCGAGAFIRSFQRKARTTAIGSRSRNAAAASCSTAGSPTAREGTQLEVKRSLAPPPAVAALSRRLPTASDRGILWWEGPTDSEVKRKTSAPA